MPVSLDGRHTHSGCRGQAVEPRGQRVGGQVEGGALAGDRAPLTLPGEPVAPQTARAAPPVDLHRVTAHRGQLEVSQGRSHCKEDRTGR
ncbi:hypothetical protein EYF80_015114 [Liparis tanakae]|uniref:Uncharacterized protein n=1 Tax=Liparis tanakae TaxID=230148 RepID=A0A4Z2I9F6_9TELE|nr:hypothetical protein EYF80_015114 [Liparis tanakae]